MIMVGDFNNLLSIMDATTDRKSTRNVKPEYNYKSTRTNSRLQNTPPTMVEYTWSSSAHRFSKTH